MLIGYARVSTEEQSLKLQKTALRDAGCETIFEDKGISGAVFRRPGFETLLALVRDAGFSEAQIVEIIAVTAENVFTNLLNVIAQTDIDFPVVHAAKAA